MLPRRGAGSISSDRDPWKLLVTTDVSLRKGHYFGYLYAGHGTGSCAGAGAGRAAEMPAASAGDQ
jgi:hypothetical protein